VTRNVDEPPRPTFRGLLTTSAGLLAASLLVVELVGGIQTYVTSTVTPLAAAELSGQGLYGVAQGASQVGLFLTLPFGAYLASRFDRRKLLLVFTGVAIVGAVVGAAAPSMAWYAAGRGITGIAAGALATIAMNVVAGSLPKEWRRFVLSGYAGMWVVTSLVGPLYSSWISALVGWRWTMILYLPLLIAARFLVARHLPAASAKQTSELPSERGSLATQALFAARTIRFRRGRPSAIALLGILTWVYFGASAVITIVGHDVFHIDPLGIGVLLTLGGLGWAVVGLICGRRPSPDQRGFMKRVGSGGALLAMSLAAIAVSPLLPDIGLSVIALFAGWAGSGAGMGLCYLELLSRIFDQPAVSDGISAQQASSAAVMVEMITTALASTATATALSGGASRIMVAIVFAVLAAFAVPLIRPSRAV
jgi:MFS family permease